MVVVNGYPFLTLCAPMDQPKRWWCCGSATGFSDPVSSRNQAVSELNPMRIGCVVVGRQLSPSSQPDVGRLAEFFATFTFMGSATC